MKLKSIKEEEADCRAAFSNSEVGDLVNFCHHEYPLEILSDPAENRIDYILKAKTDNVALRLRLFRPAKLPVGDVKFDKARAAYDKARAAYDKAGDAYRKAWDTYRKAWDTYRKAGDAYDKARAAYDKAWAAYDKAWAAYDKARAAYDKAGDAYDKAWAAYRKAWDTYRKAGDAYDKAYLPHFKKLFGVEWKGSIFETFKEEE